MARSLATPLSNARSPRRLALDGAVADGECFPLDQSDPVHVLAGKREPVGQGLTRVVGRPRRPRHPLLELTAQDLAEEVVLVAEVVVEHPLVDAGAAGDAVDARARQALGGELVEGGGEDPLAGALRVAGHHPEVRGLGERVWP